MEKHLRAQINPLLITILGLEKVRAKYSIKDFNPIGNVEQAKFIAKEVGVTIPDIATPEEICQAVVDYNNETGFIFRNRNLKQIILERKAIAKELGQNPNLVPTTIVGKNGEPVKL